MYVWICTSVKDGWIGQVFSSAEKANEWCGQQENPCDWVALIRLLK